MHPYARVMICRSCGASNTTGARFCSSCGHPVVARTDERRVATVLFADLVGFTTLAESRDPEQVKNLVDRCFQRLARDVKDFGGLVDKIVGDALVALFGAPVAHEDDAERAVRAALRMQQTVAAYAAEAGAGLQLRIGVNTGEVLFGALRAGGDLTAMGDVVNTAQRLQAGAVPGAVVVGRSTYNATRDAIGYESLGSMRAKGREEPVDAWRALAALQPPGARPRRPQTPFVGRLPELAALSHAVDVAFERGRALAVLLVGDAGVGKSRLAEEVAARAREVHHAVVPEGRCVPYGEANVWWPVAEVLRQVCDIASDAPLPRAEIASRAAVAAALGLQPDEHEVGRIAEGLLFLMGYEVPLREIDPQRAREEAVRSVLTFLDHASRRRPVVIVVSDLHWADQPVLDLAEAVLDRLSRNRIVLLATARQELRERWRLPAGRHNAVELHVDPLDRDAAGRLLGSLLSPDADDGLREALLDRSGGNPFFLEELVALLAGSDRDTVRAVAPEGSLSGLPDTLRGLVLARLDSLDRDERIVVEDASVWGRSGPVEALERMAVAMHGLGEVSPAIERLATRELLVLHDTRWSFHSDLIREVAYGTLTKSDRARRHAGIAQYLEGAQPLRHDAPDRLVDVVAHHYGAAAELVADLGGVDGLAAEGLTERALDWLEEAARRAEVAQMAAVAARLHAQALRLLGERDPGRRVRLLLGRASAQAELRRTDEARADLLAARALATALGDDAAAARSRLVQGELEQRRGDYAGAIETLAVAVGEFRALGDAAGVADALRAMGMAQIFLERYEEAEASIRSALAASRGRGDRRGEAWALQNLAWISYIQGRVAEAERRLETAASTFEELGDRGGLMWAIGLLAFVRYHQGRFEDAERLGDEVLVEARQRGDRWGEGMMHLLLAGVRLWTGRAAQAVRAAEEGRAAFHHIGDVFGDQQAIASLGRALVTAGRVQEGFDVLREGLDRLVAGGHQAPMLARHGLAGAAVQVGDPALALVALGDFRPEQADPARIGGSEELVTYALALVQLGRAPEAVEILAPCTEVDERVVGSLPYARSALALACAAVGHPGPVAELVADVQRADRATYLDLATARLAALLCGAAVGRGVGDDVDALLRLLDATEDAVGQAVVRLGAGRALAAIGDQRAAVLEDEAASRLRALGIAAEGWYVVFDAALAAGRSVVPEG